MEKEAGGVITMKSSKDISVEVKRTKIKLEIMESMDGEDKDSTTNNENQLLSVSTEQVQQRLREQIFKRQEALKKLSKMLSGMNIPQFHMYSRLDKDLMQLMLMRCTEFANGDDDESYNEIELLRREIFGNLAV